MITQQVLDVYLSFGGDIDGFARVGSAEARTLVPADAWYQLDSLLQDMRIVKSGQASDAFEKQLRERIAVTTESAAVATQIWAVA